MLNLFFRHSVCKSKRFTWTPQKKRLCILCELAGSSPAGAVCSGWSGAGLLFSLFPSSQAAVFKDSCVTGQLSCRQEWALSQSPLTPLLLPPGKLIESYQRAGEREPVEASVRTLCTGTMDDENCIYDRGSAGKRVTGTDLRLGYVPHSQGAEPLERS